MRRIPALALVLCAGCASAGGDSLLEDSLWGDIRSFFSGRYTPASVSSAGPSPAYGGNTYSVAPRTAQGPVATPGQPLGDGSVPPSSDSSGGP
jgi:hypothetical protein